jgi:hypothetical protein
MMADEVALLRLQQRDSEACGRVHSSWQEGTDRQCSNCTRVFPWFSIQHNVWSFEVSESARELKDREKNEPNGSVLATSLTPCRWSRRYVCLTGLLLGTNHGCITTNPNRNVHQCNGNIPVHLLTQPKSLRLRHQLGRVMFTVFLGFSGSSVSPFSEAWWKCESCIILWSSVEASGCSSQKTSGPTDKRVTASLWQCQTPYRPSNPGENSVTKWELFEHSIYSPDLAPNDFHLFGPLKKIVDKRFAGDEELETEVRKWQRQQSKRLICRGFRRTGKATGPVY